MPRAGVAFQAARANTNALAAATKRVLELRDGRELVGLAVLVGVVLRGDFRLMQTHKVPAVPYQELRGSAPSEPSAEIRARVERATG